jgi:hypothetical protein
MFVGPYGRKLYKGVRLMKKTEWRDRMGQQGYESVSDFIRRSGCPVSLETARLAISEGRSVTVPSQILIMKYLAYSPKEIKTYLQAKGEKEFSSLLADDAGVLAPWQESFLRVADVIRRDPPMWNLVVSASAAIINRVLHVDMTQEIESLYMR